MSCIGDNDYKLFSTNGEYGEKYQYDGNFKGPKSSRSATDVNWLWAFMVCAVAWLIFGICVLSNDSNNLDDLSRDLLLKENEIFAYLKQTVWCYFGPILIATVICLIFSYGMRWFAAPAVWISIFLLIAAFALTSVMGFVLHSNTKDGAGSGLVVGVTFAIFTVITIGYVYWQRQKISVAVVLVKEGSKAVASSYSTVFFPIVPSFFRIAFFGMFASIIVNISLTTSPESPVQAAMIMLNLFGFLWIIWFIDGFVTMVLAHTYSNWYWTMDKNNLPVSALTVAVRRTIRYHLGTVALGSMLITIGQIICYIIKSIMNNRYTRVFSLCCNISEMVERLLKFLNKNTFIMVAIHGNPFCKSMRDAFNLLMRNITSVIVTNQITKLPFAIFNMLIAAGMGGITYALLPKPEPNFDRENELFVLTVPIVISILGSLIVGNTLFGVYTMAVDTMFLCFLEDCERNDGSEQRPYYMPKKLMETLRKNTECVTPPLEHQV